MQLYSLAYEMAKQHTFWPIEMSLYFQYRLHTYFIVIAFDRRGYYLYRPCACVGVVRIFPHTNHHFVE